jgi:ferredoxin
MKPKNAILFAFLPARAASSPEAGKAKTSCQSCNPVQKLMLLLVGEEEAMKVEVDQMKCGTVGLCVKECPEVFRFQEGSKKASVIIGVIPPDLQKKCRDAARKCPNAAITIEE